MNHNIGNVIADKVVKSREKVLTEIIYLMSRVPIENCEEDIQNLKKSIIDYIKTAEFNKELFKYLLLYLENCRGCSVIYCEKEDIPILVYYREKCDLGGSICFRVYSPMLIEDLEKMAEELLELGVIRIKESIFSNNIRILESLPDNYNNAFVLSYLCADCAWYPSSKIKDFLNIVEEWRNKKN